MPDVFAAVPQWAVDLGIGAGILSTVIGAIYLVGKFSTSVRNAWVRLMRWLWSGFEGAVSRATDDIRNDVATIKHVTNHHLGPNGDTPPLYKRVAGIERRMVRLEAAHDIEDDGADA